MKKVVMALIIMGGMIMTAQNGRDQEREKDWKSWSPEQIANLEVKKMTLALDLSQEQAAKMKGLFTERAKDRKAHMAEREKRRAANEARPTAEERYALANDRLDKEIAFKKEVRQILDKEQYAKWERIQMDKRTHERGRRGPEKREGTKRKGPIKEK